MNVEANPETIGKSQISLENILFQYHDFENPLVRVLIGDCLRVCDLVLATTPNFCKLVRFLPVFVYSDNRH
jgi:hypothetical protein